MNASSIGIKIADGSFYPILHGEGGGNKRLVLTTVRDNQESVQIDLYKGYGKELQDARYIGSLMIENIEPGEKGAPEIELIVGIDEEGNLNATADDKATGEKQSLSVSLAAFDETGVYDMPDFEIEDDIDTLSGVTPEEESRLTSEKYTEEEEPQEEEEEPRARKKHPFLLIGFIILGLVVIAILALLLYRNLQGPEVPALEAEAGPQVKSVQEEAAEEAEVPEEEPAEVAPGGVTAVPAGEPVPPVEEAPAETPSAGGVWYRIKWGDTLWDISNAFYKNPWLYPVIAEKNNIKNPDFILAETKIYIPSR